MNGWESDLVHVPLLKNSSLHLPPPLPGRVLVHRAVLYQAFCQVNLTTTT